MLAALTRLNALYNQPTKPTLAYQVNESGTFCARFTAWSNIPIVGLMMVEVAKVCTAGTA